MNTDSPDIRIDPTVTPPPPRPKAYLLSQFAVAAYTTTDPEACRLREAWHAARDAAHAIAQDAEERFTLDNDWSAYIEQQKVASSAHDRALVHYNRLYNRVLQLRAAEQESI